MTEELSASLQKSGTETELFRIDRLCYRYGNGIEALSNVNVRVLKNERIALVGHNGSGKTTLAKLLCGLLPPSAGRVQYKGQPLTGAHLNRSRLEIGLLFQDPDDQLFGHTLVDDAAFGPRSQGLSITAAAQAARQSLELVGLVETAYKAPHNLSFGQKKRAALAGLLAMTPEVLILDEPTANLDPRQEEIFLSLFRNFPGTLICISHDLLFLYELCFRAVVLDRGRVHHDITMRELVSHRGSLRDHGLDFSFRLAEVPELPPCADAAATTAPDAPKGAALVSLVNFHYRYSDGTRALQGVHLNIYEGEKIAIVGENGAGKSTLLSCLLGLKKGQGGFFFEGLPVTQRRRNLLWRRVGMVFQDCADQLFSPSVEEEVAFGPKNLGYSVEETQNRVRLALAQVRLSGFEDRVPLHLSGGERKRLALACVLAMEPKLLILDEPTAGLDPRGEELLLEILRNLNATLLLVCHDLFFVQELTRRTIVMHQGAIIRDLTTRDFMQDKPMGNLNGMALGYRQHAGAAIQALQHEHAHAHPHAHLHIHEHRHGDTLHRHPHEHLHDHAHRFVHQHTQGEEDLGHLPRRYHLHDHSGHEQESHDHDHE
ncbi:MAG: energy-coupling factor transporter ATPase [Desulfobacterales bacterium]|jgi:energy-coupling factor transporter ATP-binding protein EcfA2|nr:energy-coupling factor transporter ATPase [Desulfobacterales bacterium]